VIPARNKKSGESSAWFDRLPQSISLPGLAWRRIPRAEVIVVRRLGVGDFEHLSQILSLLLRLSVVDEVVDG
jgi:hypothetical protein